LNYVRIDNRVITPHYIIQQFIDKVLLIVNPSYGTSY